MAEQGMKNSIQQKLVESGKYDELKELLRRRLIESGWRDELKTYATELVQSKGEAQLTVEQLTADITPQGRASVPDDVKAELLENIRSFVESHSSS